jgi:hypothetical protein
MINNEYYLNYDYEKGNNISENKNGDSLIERLQNEILNLKKKNKQIENKASVLEGENNIFRKITYEKDQLILKFQKVYLKAKTRIVVLLEENKKLIKEVKTLKEKIEIFRKERKIEKYNLKKEKEEKVDEYKTKIDKMQKYYGTQITEKDKIISDLENLKNDIENKLIISNIYNNRRNDKFSQQYLFLENNEESEINNNYNIRPITSLNRNIKTPNLINKNKSKINKINLNKKYLNYSEIKTNKTINFDSNNRLMLINNNTNINNILKSSNYFQHNKLSEYLNQCRQKYLSSEHFKNKKTIAEKNDKSI